MTHFLRKHVRGAGEMVGTGGDRESNPGLLGASQSPIEQMRLYFTSIIVIHHAPDSRNKYYSESKYSILGVFE